MVVVVRRRKEPRRVDYRNYFVMGVIWLAFAPFLILLPWLLHGEEPFFMGSFFLMIGLGYTIIGLMNRDKWGKQVEVPLESRKKMMIVLGFAALVGALVALLLATRFLFLR
jgi:nitrate reductase gamma subunit